MNTRVISISRQVGTSGEEVGHLIAQKTGFRFIDYQVIQQAAQEAGVSPETVSEAEHSPSLMTRLLEALARNPGMPVTAWAEPVPLTPMATSADYRTFIEAVIKDLADQGNCVIIGHAAHLALRTRFDTLRCFITSSMPFRVRRIVASMGLDQKAALRMAEKTDAERIDYFRRFHDSGWLTPWSYDLCLNTDHLSPHQAADVILKVAEMR
jgi:cytidylate kinase